MACAWLGGALGVAIWRFAPGPRRAGLPMALCGILPATAPLAIWAAGGAGVAEGLAACAWLWLLLALAQSDLRCQRLPDPLTGALALAALIWVQASGVFPLSHGIVSGAAGAAAFWLLRLGYRRLRHREGLGLGDVKLMIGISAAVGLALLPWVTLVAALAALTVALGTGLGRTSAQAEHAMPFGAYLAAAAALVWLLAQA